MSERNLRMLYIAVDYLSTLIGVIAFSYLRFHWVTYINEKYECFTSFLLSHGSVLTLSLYPLFMLFVYYLSGFYVTVRNKSRAAEFISTVCSVAVGAFVFFMVVLLNDVLPKRTSNYELLLLLYISIFIPVLVVRLVTTTLLVVSARSRGANEKVVYISDSDRGPDPALLRKEDGINRKVIEKLKIDTSVGQLNYWLSNKLQELDTMAFDSFVVNIPDSDPRLGLSLLGELYVYEKPIYVSADYYKVLTSKVIYNNLLSEPLIDISRIEMSDCIVAMKRASDVVGSVLGLLLASPIIICLAVAVKIGSTGPAFYRQERIGYRRKPFHLCKLRSMSVDAEASGPALTANEDPRVTRIGRFMRKYRLDELPNLWNVLRGDMSLVGPRPEREFFLEKLRQRAPYCTLIHQVRPGVTSLGMVKYGYASSVDEMLERLKYDIIYMQNLSPQLDFKILFHTVRTVIGGKGK